MKRLNKSKISTIEKAIATMLALLLVVTLVPIGAASYADITGGDNIATNELDTAPASEQGQGQPRTEYSDADVGDGTDTGTARDTDANAGDGTDTDAATNTNPGQGTTPSPSPDTGASTSQGATLNPGPNPNTGAAQDASPDSPAAEQSEPAATPPTDTLTDSTTPANPSATLPVNPLVRLLANGIGTLAAGDLHIVTVRDANDQTVALLTVFDGELADEPEPPTTMPPGANAFMGWFDVDVITAAAPAAPNPNDRFDFTKPITKNYTLKAVYTNDFLVQIVNEFGLVVAAKTVTSGQKLDKNSIYPPAYAPPQGEAFTGTYHVMVQQDGSWVEGGEFDFNTVINSNYTTTSNYVLHAHSATAWQVYFVTNGSAVATQTVFDGGKATTPTPPTRPGYTFARWSATQDGAAYNFNTPVQADTTLFAVWTPAKVGFRITYWVEKANIIGDPGMNADNYELKYVRNVASNESFAKNSATTMSEAELAALAAGYYGEAAAAQQVLNYATYAFADNHAISGIGDTNINLYYKRVTYEVRWDVKSAASNATSGDNNGGITTGKATAWFERDGTEYQTATNPDVYSFYAKAEQSIIELEPGLLSIHSGDSMTFAGWKISNSNFGINGTVRTFTLDHAALAQANGGTVTFIVGWYNGGTVYPYYCFNYVRATAAEQLAIVNSGVTVFVVTSTNNSTQFSTSVPLDNTIDGVTHRPYVSYGGNIYMYHSLARSGLPGGKYTHTPLPGTAFASGAFTSPAICSTVVYRNAQNVFYGYVLLERDISIPLTLVATPGGKIGGQQQTVQNKHWGDMLTGLPTPTPDNASDRFVGWFLDTDHKQPMTETTEMSATAMSLFAKYESTAQTVTFRDTQGGNVVATAGTATGAQVADPEVYATGQSYAGLGTFLGWHIKQGTNIIPFGFETSIYSDTEVFGTWQTDGFKITYNLDGGTGATAPTDPNLYDFHNDALARVLAPEGGTPTKEVDSVTQTFVGWVAGGVRYYPGEFFTPYGDMQMVARYLAPAQMRTLTFNPNGGTGSAATWTFANGESTTLPSEVDLGFTRTGYGIAGWSTGSGASVPDVGYATGESVTVTTNRTLYAVWAPKQVAIGYHKNDGSSNDDYSTGATLVGNYGSSIATPPTVPVRTGYTFGGWSKAAGTDSWWNFGNQSSPTQLTTGNGVLIDAHNGHATLELYARWTPKSYTVNINPNHDGLPAVAQSGLALDSSTVNLTQLTYANHQLLGYSLTSTDTAATYTQTSMTLTANAINALFAGDTATTTTLYAIWSENPKYTVVYGAGTGGTGSLASPTPAYINTNTTLANLTAASAGFTRAGYHITGWNTAVNGSGTAYGLGATYTSATGGNKTLYAQWAVNTNAYSVAVASSSAGFGSVSTTGGNTAPGNINYGATVTYAAVANAGYHFVSWTATGITAPSAATGTFTMPDNAVGLQANFAADTVTLTVNKNGAAFLLHGKTFKLSTTQPALSSTTYTGTGTGATVTFDVVPNATYYLFEGTTYTGVSFTKSGASATATINYYTLTVAAGTGGTTPVGSGDYYVGQVVSIDVSTSTGYTFKEWTRTAGSAGTVSSANKSGSFTMGASIATVTASFDLNSLGYTVTANGHGSVTAGSTTTPSGNVSYGSTVTYLATPDAGYHFVDWAFSGITLTTAQTTTPSGTFSMPNGAVSLTATFAEDANVSINYQPDASAHGSVSRTSQSLAPATGTALSVTATAAAGYNFANWTKDGDSTFTPITTATFTPAKVGGLNVAATYTANFTPIDYMVSYNAGTGSTGGTVPVDSRTDYHVGDKVTIKANTNNLARTGYTLAGWRADNSGTGAYWTAGTSTFEMPAANVTFYPVWTANTYVVSFDAHGGTFIQPPTYTVTFDSTYGAPSNTFPGAPVLTGYNFNGWYTAESGGTKVEGTTTVATAAPHTLHAQYSPKDVTVSFDLNYSPAPAAPSAVSVKYDATYISAPAWPTDPTRSGYTFAGWKLDASGAGTTIGSTTTVQNEDAHSVYARWSVNTVTLYVQKDGVPWSGHNKTFRLSSTSTSLSATNYTGVVSGDTVTFDAISNGTWYLFDGTTYLNDSVTVTYSRPTPNFELNYYTVTFEANGGSTPSPASKVYFSGQQFGAFPTVTKDNWTLVSGGWFNLATGGTQKATTDTVTAKQSVYPHWTENDSYTVTYHDTDSTGGTPPVVTTEGNAAGGTKYYVNTEAVVLGLGSANPLQKTNYDFTGWTTDSAGSATSGTYYSLAAIADGTAKITITADTDLYPVWVERTVIYFDSKGGSSVPAFHIENNTEYMEADDWPSADPVRTGYSFEGWYDAETGGNKIVADTVYAPPTSATTLYAYWSAKAVTVTFYNNASATDSSVYVAGATANAALKYDGTLSSSTGEPTRSGYTFAGWYTARSAGTAYTLNDTIVSVANGVTDASTATPKLALYAHWTPNSATAYKVESYYQSAEGAPYGAATSTSNRTGETDATAEVTGADKTPTNPALYMLDDAATGKLYSGTIAGDGTTVLRVYFKVRFTPIKDTHYSTTVLSTTSPAGWTNSDFVLTAKSGYQLSSSETGPWSATITNTAETNSGSVDFYVKRTGFTVGAIYQNEVSQVHTESYKIDKTAPTAQIAYKNSALREFLNVVTFGLFFNDTTEVSITGADSAGVARSGVASVEHFKTTATYADATTAFNAALSFGWTNTPGDTATFTINPADKGKYHIFARVTDVAGNQTIYLDSAVIYTDAGADAGSNTYYRASPSTTTVSYTLATGGNTVSEVRNTTAGATGVLLTANTDYVYTSGTGETGTLTLTNAYLSALQAATTPYTFTVSYSPLGVTFVSGAINDTPAVTGFKLTVAKSSQATLAITGLGSGYTYGDSPVTTIATSGGSGAGNVSYTLAPASGVASVLANDGSGTSATLGIVAPGTFTLSATKAADANYDSASATSSTVTVAKAVPSVSVLASGGASYGADVTVSATVTKVGVGAIPTGSVDFYVDGAPVASGQAVSLDASGKASCNAGALSGGDHVLEVFYNGNNYYKGYGTTDDADTTTTGARSAPYTYTVGKAADSITIAPVTDKLYGDTAFAMTLSDVGSGTGAVSWTSSDASVVTINATSGVVTITGTGTTTITATKAADVNYNGASATYALTIDKATPVWATVPVGAQITYGQTLSDSTLSAGAVYGYGEYGADTLVGTLAWTTPATIPDVTGINAANDTYSVSWTPSGTYAANYNPITTDGATVPVAKATPVLATALHATPIGFDTPLSASSITGGNVTYLRAGVATPVTPSTDGGRLSSNGWTWSDDLQRYPYCGIYSALANFLPQDTARFNTIASSPIDVTVYSPQTKITVPPVASGITYGEAIGTSALDTSAAKAIAVGEAGNPSIPGSWAWSTPTVLANAAGTLTSEVTFTPDDLTATPSVPFSGYVRSTVNVSIAVAKAEPTLEFAQASSVLYGQTLFSSQFAPGYSFSGVFGEPLAGTLVWKTLTIVPSDNLSGGTGTYQALAVFIPEGGFEDNYQPLEVYIPLEVHADKSALIELEDSVQSALGPLAKDIHEENYSTKDIDALKAALGAANVVLTDDAATQDAVAVALAALKAAYSALVHDHPVLEHSHPGGVTALGEQVKVRIKGQLSDVTALSLGGADLALGPTGTTGERTILSGETEVGTLTAGSAVLTFSAKGIDSLKNGTYPLVVTFVDNIGTGQSTGSSVADSAILIKRAPGTGTDPGGGEVPQVTPDVTPDAIPGATPQAAPQTGDNPLPLLLAVLLALAGTTALMWHCWIIKRRRKTQRR